MHAGRRKARPGLARFTALGVEFAGGLEIPRSIKAIRRFPRAPVIAVDRRGKCPLLSIGPQGGRLFGKTRLQETLGDCPRAYPRTPSSF